MSDWELLQSYVEAHSEAAFAEIALQYSGFVHRACLRTLHDQHLAEDATQTVFSILIAHADNLSEGPLGPWLRATARFVCANASRTMRLRHRHEFEAGCLRAADGQVPGRVYEADEIIGLLLGNLPAAERLAVKLRYIDGRRIEDIADALGISKDAAKKRVSRALSHLRRSAHVTGADKAESAPRVIRRRHEDRIRANEGS